MTAIFYDTETTGISSDKDRVIEIAAYDPNGKRTFHRLVNPKIPIPAEATAIHNITNEMVANAPTFAEIVEEFIIFCGPNPVLIAHNNDGFDIHFIRAEFSRCNTALPAWRFLDSLKWARRYRPDLPRHSLQFLREAYDIPANTAHRALDDVVILHQLFTAMTDDLDIELVYQLMCKPKEIQHMPFGKYQGQPLNKVPKDYIAWLSSSGSLDKPENQDLRAALQRVK